MEIFKSQPAVYEIVALSRNALFKIMRHNFF